MARLALLLLLAACAGCAHQSGHGRPPEHERVARESGWIGVDEFPDVRQSSDQGCGAAALSAVLAYWGRPIAPEAIENALSPGSAGGLRAGALRDFAQDRGFAAFAFTGSFSDIERELGLARPVIVGSARRAGDDAVRRHYQVVVGYHPDRRLVLTFDPASGFEESSFRAFREEWERAERLTLVVMGQ